MPETTGNTLPLPRRSTRMDYSDISDATLGDLFDRAASLIEKFGFHPNTIEYYELLSATEPAGGPLPLVGALNSAEREMRSGPIYDMADDERRRCHRTANGAIAATEDYLGMVANDWSDSRGRTHREVVQLLRTLAANFNS